MTTRYRATAEEFLRKAHEKLAAGDLQQASEKAWGAAAQIIKAAASARGWEHNSHGKLFDVARRLSEEADDPQIATLFHAAGSMHTNFYENWWQRESVEVGTGHVEELVRRVAPLI